METAGFRTAPDLPREAGVPTVRFIDGNLRVVKKSIDGVILEDLQVFVACTAESSVVPMVSLHRCSLQGE